MVVGGGLAGLTAAVRLHESGHKVLVLEQSDRPGGRLKTDLVDGFRLDHGFQVAFTAYPALQSMVDEAELQYKAFENGSLLWDGRNLQEVHRDKPLAMALSTYLTLGDKLKTLGLTRALKGMSVEQIRRMPDQTAEAYLKGRGFSDAFLRRFAQPFFGGIFLDRSLQTSARQFCYVWKMLGAGETVIPALGIAAIPKQLVARLPESAIRCGSAVDSLLHEGNKVTGVRLSSGEELRADRVIVATEADAAERLTQIPMPKGCRSSTCLYFAAERPPVDRRILVLNATDGGMVNEVVPVSVVTPDAAPAGKHLVSVTLLGWHDEPDEELASRVIAEVAPWFPNRGVLGWKHLRTYRIRYAQMDQHPGIQTVGHGTKIEDLSLAGEFNSDSSINGAIQSGWDAAGALLGASA